MSTENIDDLFRRQLGDHATPPSDDLWARLLAAPAAEPAAAVSERVDRLYQQGLKTHATPTPREVWERLEDEYLRPRERRAAAWWPRAIAAAVALLLLAGGAGYWLSFSSGTKLESTVASRPQRPNSNTQNAASPHKASSYLVTAATPIAATATLTAGQKVAQTSTTTVAGVMKIKPKAWATHPASPASRASKGEMMAQHLLPRSQKFSRQPDAAVADAPPVARTSATNNTTTPLANEPALTVATTTLPVSTSLPVAENVPAANAPAALATLITVDVRNGAARRPTLATAVATAAASGQHQGLGSRLLRQVGHVVRGERLSLAEVTGLPQTLTLEATIAGHRVSKSIQL